MDRRDSIKSLFLGSVAAGLVLQGCAPDSVVDGDKVGVTDAPLYGRTEPEKVRDQKLHEDEFFNEHELTTIAVLCDIILPKNNQFGSASDSGVVEFVDFIVKDMTHYQTPLRGGVMWLDGFSNRLYNKEFVACSDTEQLAMCDRIAYPKKTKPELKQGEQFFTRMRNLTLTGYFTSKMGIEDLGYKGNSPNVWDGVPEEVLKDHSVSYDPDWLVKCVDQSKRADLAQWDDDGNLIS